ncbi:MAG: hypothetical protein WC485_05340 [Opitutaceae bacterium]
MTSTIRFSEAKRNFARVGARAKRGDVVYLQHGPDRFQLVYHPPAEPVPHRPPGHFRPTAQDLAEINGARTDATA